MYFLSVNGEQCASQFEVFNQEGNITILNCTNKYIGK